jgi:hypothetical protein
LENEKVVPGDPCVKWPPNPHWGERPSLLVERYAVKMVGSGFVLVEFMTVKIVKYGNVRKAFTDWMQT